VKSIPFYAAEEFRQGRRGYHSARCQRKAMIVILSKLDRNGHDRYLCELGEYIDDPAALDYNLRCSNGGASNGSWERQGGNYAGYSTCPSKAGNDSHSPPSLDPGFVSLKTPPNLAIQTTSPAVKAGTNLGASIVGTVDSARKSQNSRWRNKYWRRRRIAIASGSGLHKGGFCE
jgi:hypothetical protein